jgi:hypothetical protein
MPVTEQLMSLGDWTLKLRPDTPRTVTDPLRLFFSHLVITPARFRPEVLESGAPAIVDAPGAYKDIALVVGNAGSPTFGDRTLRWLLETTLGHAVTYIDDGATEVTASTSTHDLVVVAPSVTPAALGTTYRARSAGSLPVLNLCAPAWVTTAGAFVNAATVSTGAAQYGTAAVGGDADFTWRGVAHDGQLWRLFEAASSGQYAASGTLWAGGVRVMAPQADGAAVLAYSYGIGDAAPSAPGALTARVVGHGVTEANLAAGMSGWFAAWVAGAVEWLAPSTVADPEPPRPPSDFSLWVIGGVMSGGAFTDAAEEAAAAKLAAHGYTVTRRAATSLTAAPLTSDCNAVVHLSTWPSDWNYLRATTAGAAPILSCSNYLLGTTAMRLSTSSTGSGRVIDDPEVRNTTDIEWTNGHTVGARPVLFTTPTYQEYYTLATSTSAAVLSTTTSTTERIAWLAPAGATNTSGTPLAARVATWALFPAGVSDLTALGLDALHDLILWLSPPPPVPEAAELAANILEAAIYTGVVDGVRRRGGAAELTGVGLAFWLGDGNRGQVPEIEQPGVGSFAAWVASLVPPALTAGTITAAGSGTYTAAYAWATRRKALGDVCDRFGGEWRITPAGRLDAGTAEDLYGTGIRALALGDVAALDGDTPHAFAGADVAVEWDAADYVTGIAALGTAVVGTAELAADVAPYRDLAGNALDRADSITASEVTVEAEAAALAAAELARTGIARTVRVTVDEYLPTRWAPVGSVVGVYAPDVDAVDPTNPIVYGGRTVFPIAARLLRVTWPIRRGCGVYLLSGYGAAAGRITDITEWVEWDTGRSTLEVDAVRVPSSVARSDRYRR